MRLFFDLAILHANEHLEIARYLISQHYVLIKSLTGKALYSARHLTPGKRINCGSMVRALRFGCSSARRSHKRCSRRPVQIHVLVGKLVFSVRCEYLLFCSKAAYQHIKAKNVGLAREQGAETRSRTAKVAMDKFFDVGACWRQKQSSK